MGKKGHLRDFERGMVVGAQLSLGFTENCPKRECGRKCLVDVRGQRRMGRPLEMIERLTITQITTRNNQGMLNTISERTTRQTLKQMDYSSRRPHLLFCKLPCNCLSCYYLIKTTQLQFD